MEKNYGQNQNGTPLFGQPTPAKASGLAFSVASLLPTLLFVVAIAFFSAFGLTGEEYREKDWYRYLNYLLPQLSFALIAVFYLRYTKTPLKVAAQDQKCHPKYFLVAFLLQVGLLSLSELNGLFLKFLENFGYKDAGMDLPNMDGFGFVGVMLVAAVLPAIFEEIMFRGVLLGGIRSAFKTPVAVLICGAMFSLYHQNPAQTVYQFCCGAAFALVAIRAGSILPTVLSHFINNAVILLLYKLEINTIPTPVFVPLMIVSGLCLLGSLGYLIFADKQKKQETDKAEIKRFFLFASIGILVCTLTWASVLVAGL